MSPDLAAVAGGAVGSGGDGRAASPGPGGYPDHPHPGKVLYRGPRGAEWYSGGPGMVIDLPTELLAQVKGRVEPAPPGSEIHGVPLQEWMRTDD